MAGELLASLTELRSIVGAVTGLNAEPTSPPSLDTEFPFYEIRPNTGNIRFRAAQHKQSNHTPVINIHYGLPTVLRVRDLSSIETYLDAIADALRQNVTLNDTVNGIELDIPYSYGILEYGGLKTVGYQISPTYRIESAESGGTYAKR